MEIQLDRRTVRSVIVTNPEGYFDVHVAFTHSGSVRLAWSRPGDPTIYSRDVAINETAATVNPAVLVGVLGGVLILACSVLVRRLGRTPAARRR